MQKTDFLFPFREECAVSGKEEQPQIFLPPVPLVLLSLQRHISHPHGNRTRNIICLSAEDPLNKAAQSTQHRQWHQSSLWDLSCPWTPGLAPPSSFPSQNPTFFSSRSPTEGQKAGIIFPVKQWGYLSAASTTSLPYNIFSPDIFI